MRRALLPLDHLLISLLPIRRRATNVLVAKLPRRGRLLNLLRWGISCDEQASYAGCRKRGAKSWGDGHGALLLSTNRRTLGRQRVALWFPRKGANRMPPRSRRAATPRSRIDRVSFEIFEIAVSEGGFV